MGSAQSRMDGGEASAPGCTSLFPKLPDFLLVVKALWCELVDRAGEAPEGLLEAALDALQGAEAAMRRGCRRVRRHGDKAAERWGWPTRRSGCWAASWRGALPDGITLRKAVRIS